MIAQPSLLRLKARKEEKCLMSLLYPQWTIGKLMLFTRSAILSVFILNCYRTMNASHDSICTLPNDGTWKITATNRIPRELCGMRDEKIHCGLHFWAICIYQILAESFWRICLRLMKLTRDWSFCGRSSIQGKTNATCNSLCFLRLVWLSYILSDLS